MPPVLSRKRLQSDSPPPDPSPKRARAQNARGGKRKVSVFQTLDAPAKVKRTLSQTKAFLEQESDDSELSEAGSSGDEFEDVPLHGVEQQMNRPAPQNGGEDDNSESQDENWENALSAHHHSKTDHGPAPVITGDIALTLSAAPKPTFDMRSDGKRGPTKTQRQIRNVTHCVHVQYLMFHNLVRNGWVQDIEVQKILVGGLTSVCWDEIQKYWRDASIRDGPSRTIVPPPQRMNAPTADSTVKKGKWKDTGQNGVKVFESSRKPKTRKEGDDQKSHKVIDKKPGANSRDWSKTSDTVENDGPNLSAGDPIYRLLRYLSAYWKAKFKVTAPSLRKRGYLSPANLEDEIKAWRDDPNNIEIFGERIDDIEAFRSTARKCQGSRDVGQQLFTALLRGLGLEARMVVSLQPVGFGWSRNEEGKPRDLEGLQKVFRSSSTQLTPKYLDTLGQSRKVTVDRTWNKASVDDTDGSDLSSIISISSDSEADIPQRTTTKSRRYNDELPYPTYWTEVISNLTHTPISCSPLPRALITGNSSLDKLANFYARGGTADKARQVFAYVIAFSSDGTAKDVTTRYLPKHQWPGRTKGFRMPVERVPIHNKRGKVKHWEEWDWFKSVMRPYARPHNKRRPWDEVEDEGDLIPMQPEKKKGMDDEGGRETLQGYKNSVEFVLERHLRRDEAVKADAKIVRHFVTGKGVNEKSEPVYRRKDIVACKTVESWHKEGREVKIGEQPLKYVPMRAVTVTRKREIEEREREEGGKIKQGLYSRAQTDWIIPDPIVDGKIPRNAFGNIDVYVPTMVPRGAVHVPLKGTARICRKLDIDYAEACTGFEFGNQRAVPVLTGVVVAGEYEDALINAWEAEEAEKVRKEAEKRQKLVLGLWRKLFSGLKIVERMKAEYGDDVELPTRDQKSLSPRRPGTKQSQWEVFKKHTNFEGGFIREDGSPHRALEERSTVTLLDQEMTNGFLQASQEEPVHGDLTIDHGEQGVNRQNSVAQDTHKTPISLTQALEVPGDDRLVSSDNDNMSVSPPRGLSGEKLHRSANTSYTGSALKPDISSHSMTNRSNKASATKSQTSKKSSTRGQRRASRIITLDDDERDEKASHSDLATRKTKSSLPTRSVPQRKAARKSEAEVKSHFFAEGLDTETDLTDLTERDSPKKKPVVTSRGRGAGKGRRQVSGRGKESRGDSR